MGKIDIEKFICDLLSLSRYGLESICFNDLKTGLQRQGLVYKDGEIVEIEKEKPLTQKEKDYIDKMVKNGSTARMEDLVYADKIKPKSIKFNEDTDFKAKVDKIVEFLKNDPGCQALEAEIHSWFEEKKLDVYTESELYRMSPYELCKILEGHSEKIIVSDDYADIVGENKYTYRVYKIPQICGLIGYYDAVEFKTGKNPYLSIHFGFGKDPYVKESDDEFTTIVHGEKRNNIIKILIDRILNS